VMEAEAKEVNKAGEMGELKVVVATAAVAAAEAGRLALVVDAMVVVATAVAALVAAERVADEVENVEGTTEAGAKVVVVAAEACCREDEVGSAGAVVQSELARQVDAQVAGVMEATTAAR